MLNSQRLWLVTGLGTALLFGPIRSSLAAGRQLLHGHVPEAVSHLQPMGRFPGTNRLSLAIGLPLRNQEELDNLLRQIYDPASPNFRRYLTPEQFTERFGPTEQDYQAVIDFAKTNGLTVTGTYLNRTLLNVSGPVADIERVFHVTIRVYQHPRENHRFHAPDTEPSLDLAVSVLHVDGLNNYVIPHPNLSIIPLSKASNLTPKVGSGPNSTYWGNDFRTAYVPGVTLTGSGQVVGLMEFDGYYDKDITNYEQQAGMTNIPLQNILLDGVSGTPGYSGVANAVAEVSLDIEMAAAMAPGLAKVIVYEGSLANSILNSMATNILARQLSTSWNWDSTTNAVTDQIFKQFAAQGQSFFDASGDSDAYTGVTGQPNDNPYITIVGGTALTMTTNAGWVSETTWNNGSGVGSSGGISTFYRIPSWQTNINMTANNGSTTMRNIPDVALTASNIYLIYNNGSTSVASGTSCAAPLWAGFTALVNQLAVASSQPFVGFINPAVYAIGKGESYTADFHDITTGNNFRSGSPTKFAATNGYDLCTGWGTPNGIALINALATPDVLGILPATGFNASGQYGGPFNITAQSYSLTNSGASSLNWSLVNTPTWLDAAPTSGTLTPGGPATTVTVSLNSAASNLFVGSYAADALFTNLNSHATQSRSFTLVVQQSVQNGGFETGDYSNWYLNGILNDSGGNSNFIVSSSSTMNSGYPGYTIIPGTQFIHSGSYGTWLGQSGSLGYLSQTLPTIPGQPYLLSFWFENSDVGQGASTSPNAFLALWNANTLYGATNLGIFNWTNMLFIVTATGTNTILQFGFRNDPGAFSLDDVSVTAVPVPAFQAPTKANGTLNFTWNALTGLVYQVQYKTNLLQTNWINLGAVIAATNYTAAATNLIGPDPQRFYRLQLLY